MKSKSLNKGGAPKATVPTQKKSASEPAATKIEIITNGRRYVVRRMTELGFQHYRSDSSWYYDAILAKRYRFLCFALMAKRRAQLAGIRARQKRETWEVP